MSGSQRVVNESLHSRIIAKFKNKHNWPAWSKTSEGTKALKGTHNRPMTTANYRNKIAALK